MVLTLGGFCTFIVYHVVLDRIAKARSRRKSNGACRYKSGKLPGDRRQVGPFSYLACLSCSVCCILLLSFHFPPEDGRQCNTVLVFVCCVRAAARASGG